MARVADEKVLDESVTSGDAYSDAIDLDSIFGYSIQFIAAGTTMNGSLVLEASNNKQDWEEVSGTSTAITGSSTTGLLNINDAFYKWVRVKVTADTNTIGIEAYYKGKGV